MRARVCPATDNIDRDRMAFDHRTPRTMEEIVDQLTEYGLSKNEAKVVTFLAKRGGGRASLVARSVKLNRTETYRTLRNLQHKGLVEASLEQPVRFQTAPLSRCLELLIAEEKSRLAALEERSGILERAFQSIGVEIGTPEFERFQVLEGRARIGQRLLFMCEDSRLQIDSILDPPDLAGGHGRLGLGTLAMLAKRGRKIRVITDINPATVRFVEPFHNLVEIRHLGLAQEPVPRISIIDDEALFGVGGVEDSSKRGSDQISLWISSRSFVRSLRAYFNDIWSSATPALARLEAVKSEGSKRN